MVTSTNLTIFVSDAKKAVSTSLLFGSAAHSRCEESCFN